MFSDSSFVRLLKARWHWAALAALLLAQVALLESFIASASPTCDEPTHLACGLDSRAYGDFSVSPDVGVFVQTWAVVPLAGVPVPPLQEIVRYRVGSVVFFTDAMLKAGLDLDSVYWKARNMIVLLNVLCALGIFLVARRLFGKAPAVCATALHCFSPLFLSNGALVTGDMAATLAFFLCCLAFWRLLRRATPAAFAFAALSGALLALSKMSGALFAPALLLIVLARSFSGASLRLELPGFKKGAVAGKGGKLLASLALCAAVAFAIWLLVWAAYGFKYQESAPGMPSLLSHEGLRGASGLSPKIFLLLFDFKLLPEAYVNGLLSVQRLAQERFSFLNGEISMTGFASFFPLVFLMKTPVAALAAFALGILAALWSLRSSFGRKRLFQLTPFLAFFAVYLAFSLSAKLNIGIRHLMPLFPALALLAALGFRQALRSKPTLLLPFLLAALCAYEALLASPLQLAYFSPLFGGRENAWRHVVDSSLDWGQDLKSLKGALEKAGASVDGRDKIHLAYFGALDAKLCGFPVKVLPVLLSFQGDSQRHELEGGFYCLSATVLQGYNLQATKLELLDDPQELSAIASEYRKLEALQASGDRKKLAAFVSGSERDIVSDCHNFEMLRLELLRRALLKRSPLANVGGSILVYKLTDAELREILGPLFSSPAAL